MSKILIVEDDSEINKMIERLLQKSGYDTVSAFSGTEALLLLERGNIDLILLDLMLPGLSGEDVLAQITTDFALPVICVSAKDDLYTRLSLIRDGADDYLTKPFNNEELLVRIEAVLRRAKGNTSFEPETQTLTFKNLTLNISNHTVSLGNSTLELTATEYSILSLLMANPKKVFTKQNIFESVWTEEAYTDDRAVTVHISNLRNKLGGGDDYIKTVWGIGYKMQDMDS